MHLIPLTKKQLRTEVRMNAEQKLAAEYEGGPLLVIAGPGTGKTTTLGDISIC